LKKIVEGRFHYDRKRGEAEALADLDNPVGANGGDSSMVLQYLTSEQSKGVRYDVLLVNCGLHAIKTNPHTGAKQIPLEQYRNHVQNIVHIAKEMAQHFIWIRTTDAVEQVHNRTYSSFLRFHDDVVAYNAVADEVMSSNTVPTIDLYTFTQAFGVDAYCDHVHYTEEVRQLQAAYIAGCLDSLIDRRDS